MIMYIILAIKTDTCECGLAKNQRIKLEQLDKYGIDLNTDKRKYYLMIRKISSLKKISITVMLLVVFVSSNLVQGGYVVSTESNLLVNPGDTFFIYVNKHSNTIKDSYKLDEGMYYKYTLLSVETVADSGVSRLQLNYNKTRETGQVTEETFDTMAYYMEEPQDFWVIGSDMDNFKSKIESDVRSRLTYFGFTIDNYVSVDTASDVGFNVSVSKTGVVGEDVYRFSKTDGVISYYYTSGSWGGNSMELEVTRVYDPEVFQTSSSVSTSNTVGSNSTTTSSSNDSKLSINFIGIFSSITLIAIITIRLRKKHI